jgi:hypothetical protein
LAGTINLGRESERTKTKIANETKRRKRKKEMITFFTNLTPSERNARSHVAILESTHASQTL